MRLKTLEINGFKSFPEKASIQFPSGISAVVGPNGCGKSNLVDALRWVMGEQSAKQLRGKAMEDVIFSGSSGRPPLNLAEVSLTLENDNGSAPEELRDYSEIMLTRRFHRSGESAYYINKRPCRLKDIHNVFLGSGLGAKSYAIIQQGNIGAIIDAGPEERRFFIEEAAGVTRFKRRKEEALRKVQATNRNLLRLTDITTEINRQMSSLKRQARKAELYQKYRDQIRQLDVLIGLKKYDDYKQLIDETAALLESHQDADTQHASRLKQIDAAVEDIRLKRWQKNQEIAEQKSRVFETQRTLDRTENDLAHHRQDISRLASEVARLTSSHATVEEKNRDIATEINLVESEISSLKKEEDQVKSRLGRQQGALQSITDKISTFNRELESGKTALMDLVTEEAKYKNIHQNITDNKEGLNRRLKRLDEDISLADKNVGTCEEILGAAQSHLDILLKKIDVMAGRIKDTEADLDEKRTALGKQVKHVQTLDLDRNKTKSRYTALKKMADNFEWYKDGVRAIMRTDQQTPTEKDPAFEKLKKEGLIGLMADIIDPKPSFEIPVEAVLGEALQHIVVKDQKTGLELIQYLQSHSAGRSGFIPASDVKPIAGKGQATPDRSKRLLNHVSVRHGFENIAEALLGHVVVTDTIAEAESVFNRNGVLQTVVTKDGDLISHQGVLIGGSKEKISGILSKKQELKQLEHQMARFDKELSAARLTQDKMESDTRTCESSLQKLIERNNELLYDRTEAEKDLYKTTEDLKHAKRHLDILTMEQDQLAGEESDLDSQIVKNKTVVAQITDSVGAAQDKVTQLSETVGGFSLEMEQFNQTVIDLNLKLTTLNARMDNNRSTRKRLMEFRDDGTVQLEQISREMAQKKQQQTVSTQKIGEFEAALSRMYDDMKRLEQDLEDNEAVYQTIDAQLKDNDNVISEIQSQREALTQKMRVLELEQSERHIKRDTIASRLEEQYLRPFVKLRNEFDPLRDDPESPITGALTGMEEDLSTLRDKIARINDVNLGAIKEYDQLQQRYEFLCDQRDDLVQAIEDLHKVIRKINRITQERFMETLSSVNEKLNEVFPRLFEGGTAQLILSEPDRPLETGVEFLIHPPGKKLTRMSLLSGGEKALSAIAFIFSIFLIKPQSFCLMDEIDAPLDDANIYRFNNLLQMIGEKSQVVMITHNKRTMEFADKLFGITMVDKGISKVVSVNLNQEDSDSPQLMATP
ncbi:MAG: chromosome segregation protein SMC [Desulfobacterales bacterium]